MKHGDAREYISMLRELVREGNEVSMLITGSSMTPFLFHEKDSICFRTPDRPLRRGDMVFYKRDDGRFVMHRICKVRSEGYYIVGDAQTEIEGPVRQDQIFAVITKVHRKGKWLGPGNFWWEFFAHVWLWVIPLRPLIMKTYSACFNIMKTK